MTKINEAAREMGRKGGKQNAIKNGKKHLSEIGKLGARKRWGKPRGDGRDSHGGFERSSDSDGDIG